MTKCMDTENVGSV